MSSPLDRTSQLFLIVLTIGIFGLQSTLAVQTSKGSPFLLSLGFSKPVIALVWTAGPVAGALAQPYFGVLSDKSRHQWGRRRPFIVRGVACMVPSLLTLAWVREISHMLGWLFRADANGKWLDILAKSIAVFSIWSFFFAFQLSQVGFRALIVDCCPPLLVDQAMLWATRMNCLGNIFCYGAGFLDLPSILPQVGGSDFQILALGGAIVLVSTTCITCSMVEETKPQDPTCNSLKDKDIAFTSVFGEAITNVSRVSKEIWTIFEVQFCAWAGWFLFTYYITTYVGALHKREETRNTTTLPQRGLLDENSTRYGSLALLLFALMTMLTTIVAPVIVAWGQYRAQFRRFLTLRNLWIVSHIIFAVSMLSTLLPVAFLHTSTGTTVLVAIIGMSWALTTWAPFSLIGEEINFLNADDDTLYGSEKASSNDVVKGSGTIMSLHITAINVPQFVATILSGLVFWLVDQNALGLTGLAWVLRLSGVAAALAAWRTLAVIDRAV